MATPADTKAMSSNSLSTSVLLTPAQQLSVLQQLDYDFTRYPFAEMRSRLMMLDLAYFMERDTTNTNPETPQMVTALYQDLELPVLQPNIDAAHAYISKIFLTGLPIFGVATSDVAPEKIEEARMLEAVVWENQTSNKWVNNLILFLLDTIKYNIGAVDVNWVTHRTFKITTDLNVNLFEGNREENFRAGNEIKHMDMYNTFYDVNTKPGAMCTEGDFIGKIERKSYIQMRQMVADLKMTNGQVMNVQTDKFWKSTPRDMKYYVPNIVNYRTVNQGTDWMDFFSRGYAPNGAFHMPPEFEVVTWYHRIIPSGLGITNVPDANNVQIWKFIKANGILIYAERMTNAHDMLPGMLGQYREDGLGLQTKGTGELLLPFQELSSTMWRARVASLARSLSDRAIYNPTMISEKNVNSALPIAKIPLRPQGYGKKISDSYYQIPYNDQTGQIVGNEIERVNSFASDAAHINRSQRGQTTKGNRTLQEYQDVQDNANSAQQLGALLLEDQVFMPMKTQILTNTMQFQQVTDVIDPNTQEVITVNPATLREKRLSFKVADGLNPKSKLLGTNATLESLQFLAGLPGANQEYDIVRMGVDAFSDNGSRVSQYKRAPEQQLIPTTATQQQAGPAEQPAQDSGDPNLPA